MSSASPTVAGAVAGSGRRAAAPTPRLPASGQDEFLAAAPLFRYGPWALMLVTVLLAVAVLVAAVWRMEVSRQGEYAKAFRFASAAAKSVDVTAGQVFALLHQVTHAIAVGQQRGSASGDALRAQFAAGLGLTDSRIRVAAIDAQGAVVALTPTLDRAQLQPLLPALHVPADAAVLPAMRLGGTGVAVVPVLHRLAQGGAAAALVHLVDADMFTGAFSAALEGQAGWLRLADTAGRTVIDVAHGLADGEFGDDALGRALHRTPPPSTRPASGDPQRLLVATAAAPNAALAVTVALGEAVAMKELEARVKTTWVIVIGAMVVVLSLASVISVAMRNFAVKEAHLRRLATIDILTGLPNRRSFHELLDKAVHRAQQHHEAFGLLFVDLDNFKDVNDAMGHEAGDLLLQRVSEILLGAVREEDRVCRLGGDEFTVLLAGTGDADEALRIGQRILDALALPQAIRGRDMQPRASIGFALMPQHATTASDLMRYADTALYRAKRGGKSMCVVYDDTMTAQALERAERSRELAVAITRDELFLEYQGKFALRDGRLTGHEALVRWQHPQRGRVPPGEFISLAEESGLIVDLGRWVLDRAVRQVREWHDAGAGWQHVAVNVSALQLRNGDFAGEVASALRRHGVRGSQLQLEITESSLVADAGQARQLLGSLRALGVSISIDDFGTGYSSLAALQQLDIDTLKVDRSFVDPIGTHEGEAVCRAIIGMAHALGMRVIAEGVETPLQREVLERLACDEIQGFLCARPTAAQAVLRRLVDARAGGEGRPAPAVAMEALAV